MLEYDILNNERKFIMKETINLTNENICIKANYDTKPTKVYDENARPSEAAVKVAHETLSDLGWRLYSNLTNFHNHAVGVAPVTSLMNELEMSYEQFTKALNELVSNRYLNFRPITNFDKVYTGNAFQFHSDNSLVAVCPISRAPTIEELKKPFFYTGTSEVKETF